MEQNMWPVDVICLSSADGNIRPLRIRAMEGFEETVIGNVCEILSTRESRTLGAEYRAFLCRIRSARAVIVLELKYFVGSHCWYLSQPGM